MVMELKEWQENVFYTTLNNLKGWVKSTDTLYVVANDLLKSRIEGVRGLEAEPYSKNCFNAKRFRYRGSFEGTDNV